MTEVMQCGLAEDQIERIVRVSGQVKGVTRHIGKPRKLPEFCLDFRAAGGVKIQSDHFGLWKLCGQARRQLAKSTADFQAPAAVQIDPAELAVSGQKQRPVRWRESSHRRQHRLGAGIEWWFGVGEHK